MTIYENYSGVVTQTEKGMVKIIYSFKKPEESIHNMHF
jgi:hypothetical protein